MWDDIGVLSGEKVCIVGPTLNDPRPIEASVGLGRLSIAGFVILLTRVRILFKRSDLTGYILQVR